MLLRMHFMHPTDTCSPPASVPNMCSVRCVTVRISRAWHRSAHAWLWGAGSRWLWLAHWIQRHRRCDCHELHRSGHCQVGCLLPQSQLGNDLGDFMTEVLGCSVRVKQLLGNAMHAVYVSCHCHIRQCGVQANCVACGNRVDASSLPAHACTACASTLPVHMR